MISFFLLGILILTNLLWLLFLPRFINRKLSSFQNELVNRHYDEVEIMYRKMRAWRHDYHNHIQALKVHLKMKQYDQMEKYLDALDHDLTSVDTVLRTGNVMVDAILNSKLSLIAEKKIKVDATACVPQQVSIAGIDLSVLIGNLLDNAIEACMQLPEEKRFIRIYIDIVKKQLYLSVTNSRKGKAPRIGSQFISEKSGNHGFGLVGIDRIVNKYQGFVNRQTEDDLFATEILLPL